PPKTMKQIMTAHLKEARCKNCHSLFDPYGFGFEHFDAIGRYRKTDAGEPVDSSGEIVGFGKFTNARDLADQLLSDEQQRISHCIIYNIWRGSLGHVETDGEKPALDDLHQRFAGDGFRLKQLLVDITVSPAFLYVAAVEQ